MKDKLILITGANSGIGKETTLRLAQLNAKIVMVCRNKKKGEIALEEIKKTTGNENLDLML